MSVDLNSNFFELFSLPAGFEIDDSVLSENYRALQREFHPDRFANADSASRRQAMQMSAHINEAFETLKNPLLKSRYLLELQAVSVNQDRDTTSDTGFLMQQMEFREQMEEVENQADPLEAADKLRDVIQSENESLLKLFRGEYEQDSFEAAKQTWLKLQFYDRLLEQLDLLEARLEDELLS